METVIDHQDSDQKLSVEILFKFFKIMAISSLVANSWKQFNSLVFVVPSPPHHGTILLNRSILNTITPNCIQYKRVLISAFFKYDGVKNINTNTKVLSTQLSYVLNAFFRDTPPAYCFLCHLSPVTWPPRNTWPPEVQNYKQVGYPRI